MSANGEAIAVHDVCKSFGSVHALIDVDLEVQRGTVTGLLGPNGAGKTTLVKILTTLLKPTSGRASVLGFDVQRQARQLRNVIGLAGQSTAIDELLTGRENLEMVGRLYHLGGKVAKHRADELLDRFSLVESADRQSKEYSGGMRRRLDLAASLVSTPQVLFLDEPTSGLDPRSRLDLWAVIMELVREGTTVLLTTQYLEEADRLADQIAVIDHGAVIARGTASELKKRAGSEFIMVRVLEKGMLPQAANVLLRFSEEEPQLDEHENTATISVANGSSLLVEVVRALDAENVVISDLGLRQPTLDDVFLALTGRTAEDAATSREGESVDGD